MIGFIPISLFLAGCTIYERIYDTTAVHEYIYDALWFQILWGIVILYVSYRCLKYRLWQQTHPLYNIFRLYYH